MAPGRLPFASLTANASEEGAKTSGKSKKKKARRETDTAAEASESGNAAEDSAALALEKLDLSKASPDAVLSAILPHMTPEQQLALQRRVNMLRNDQTRVRYEGRKMRMTRAMKKALREKALADNSAHEPMIRKKARQEVMAGIPGHKLRQGAEKMQLRPAEEAALPLDLFGKYVHERPGGRNWLGRMKDGVEEFSFGVFGRCKQAEAALRARWAGRNPAEVLVDQQFYDDIMDNAHKVELTMMLAPTADLPLVASRDTVVSRLKHTLRRTNPDAPEPVAEGEPKSARAEGMAEALMRNYTEASLARSGLLDARGRIARGSKVILSVGPNYQLTAEGITPGLLKEQRPVYLGFWDEPWFTRAVLEQFLGRYPISYQGKAQIGQGVLYVANGFRFRPCGNRNQFIEGDEPGEPDFVHPADLKCAEPLGEIVPSGMDIFKLPEEEERRPSRAKPHRPLLNGIHQRRRLLGLA